MKQLCKQRSLAAQALADKRYRQRIVRPKRGKGAYTRKEKQPGRVPGFSLVAYVQTAHTHAA